jgi:hypothetical protein
MVFCQWVNPWPQDQLRQVVGHEPRSLAELLAAVGVPVYPQLAQAAWVPLVSVSPGPEARQMLGDMIHVASVGMVMLAAQSSCQLQWSGEA